MIHFAVGTRAQLIKTAPVMKRLAERGIAYRYIDLGQHPATTATLRALFGLRAPDLSLALPSPAPGSQPPTPGSGLREPDFPPGLTPAANVASLPDAVRWAARVLSRALGNRRTVLHNVFGGRPGVCVVHGDTLSTVLGLLLAKRAGLKVCHLEAGLRSRSLLHPFPEEVFRLLCMRSADHLAAPTAWAHDNLRALGYGAKAWQLPGNTGAEAVADIVSRFPAPPVGEDPSVLVSIHRFETIMSRRRLRALVGFIADVASQRPVRFILHEPTRRRLHRYGLLRVLREGGVRLSPSLDYPNFLQLLRVADWVVTDGGSVQEECAYLGTPCLLFRKRTERRDGLGENVCLSGMEPEAIRAFVRDAARYRRPPAIPQERPSDAVIDRLVSAGYAEP